MITQISLENFKIFTKAAFNLKQITIFIGPNGSGKSSIINALMLIQQIKNSNALPLEGENIKLDSAVDLYNIPNRLMTIGLMGKDERERRILARKNKDIKNIERTLFSIKASFINNNLTNLISDIRSNNINLKGEIKNGVRSSSEIQIGWRGGKILVQPELNIYSPYSVTGHTGNLSESDLQRGINYVSRLAHSIENVMEKIQFIPANRGFSAPSYPIGVQPIDHFNITKPAYEYERDLATTLAYRRDELEKTISEWTSEITGIKIRAPLSTGTMVQIKAKRANKTNSKDIKIAYEGFGSNQLLFILLPLAQSKKRSILVIEEPELHLHPKAQAILTQRLLTESKSREMQLILTTHSEHVISSVLTNIAERTFTPEQIAIYYLNRRGQQVSRKLLDIDTSGRAKGGLPGFFEANIEEAERHLKALEKQQ